MKTKKHMIEVEIPTGYYCTSCVFFSRDGLFCECPGIEALLETGLVGMENDNCNYQPERSGECIEKFGLEDDNETIKA